MTKTRTICALVISALVGPLLGLSGAAAGAVHGGVVGSTPFAATPHVLDGKVLDIEQVGDRVVVAGSFTKVQDAPANGGAALAQSYVFAFDAATGRIDRGFAPRVSGQVNTVLAGPAGSVYVGGTFYTLNGQTSRNLVNVSLATGVRTKFRAPAFNGAINDLVLAGGRLFVAGVFSTVGGVAHGGLATLDPTTGALDGYMGVDVAENATWPAVTARASVGVSRIDVAPDGRRLVAVGNFRTADRLPREQAVLVLLQDTGAVVDPSWRTTRYEPTCSSKFDSYVRDVEFSPDGSFFTIVTTGGAFTGTLCDSAARWDVATTGSAVQPRWTAFTGGDTLQSVAVTDTAVYVGGHQRWMNNPGGRDTAAGGAVPRPGLAALDPRTGVPLAWNPGRNPRGIGAEALLVTPAGLYVGSDTEYFGNYQWRRPRLGFFPLAGGVQPPSERIGTLPGQVYLAGRTGPAGGATAGDVRSRSFTGTVAGTDTTSVTDGTDWSLARGAVAIGDALFYGYPVSGSTYSLFRRPFEGGSFGAATALDPYRDAFWSTVTAGEKDRALTYRGATPSFYAQLPTVTATAYRDGRLYYTLSTSSRLFYRYFTPDSGIVSQDEYTAATSGFGSVSGLILDGDRLFVASSSTGDLNRVSFVGGVPGGTATPVSGPGRDGADWRARAIFVGPPVNQAPAAAFEANCADLVCSFDGRASTDPERRTLSYAWDFGDGTTATGATAERTYPSGATRTVRLTVTDDKGATGTATRSVTATEPPRPVIGHRAAAETSRRAVTSVSVTVPASVQAGDGLVLALATSTAAVGSPPEGWTLAGQQTDGMTMRVFSKVATAADAGSIVTVALDVQTIATLQLAAYAGTSSEGPIASVTAGAGGAATSQTTPGATAQEGSWVLSVWSDRQAVARTWTAPEGLAVRSNLAGAGKGDLATLLADSGAPLAAGPVGGLTATVPTPSNRAGMLTIVLRPAG